MPKSNKKTDGILKKVSRLFRKKQDTHSTAEAPKTDHEASPPPQPAEQVQKEESPVKELPVRKKRHYHRHHHHNKNKEKVPPLNLGALNEKIVKVNQSPTDLPPTPQYPAPPAPLNNPSFPKNILHKFYQYFIEPIDELGTDVLNGYKQLGTFCGLDNKENQKAANDNSPRIILLSGSLSPRSPSGKEPPEGSPRKDSPGPI